jgi:hypothetical protein
MTCQAPTVAPLKPLAEDPAERFRPDPEVAGELVRRQRELDAQSTLGRHLRHEIGGKPLRR